MKYSRIFYLVILPTILSLPVRSQIGGDNVFESFDLTASARIAALGGDFLTYNDNDISLIQTNPSLLNSNLHNHLSVAYVDYYSTVNYGATTYARHFEKLGSFAGSLKYLSYGKFIGADATGYKTADFYANELEFDLGWGRSLDSLFSIGANLKYIYSSYEIYKSHGIGVDVAGSYFSRDRKFAVSFIAKNIGSQLKTYSGNNFEPLPFELQLGSSIRLKHAPISFSILINHLEKWNLSYDDPADVQTDPITGEVPEETFADKVVDFADNAARHVVIGSELYIAKVIILRGGYNYQRRQELAVDTKPAMVGFSWGIGLRLSKFHLSYSRSTYHLSGSPNYFTLSTNLSDFFIKKN